jgi:Spy/CpxP family protein refolding chaperone
MSPTLESAMRRPFLALFAALTLAACGDGATAPTPVTTGDDGSLAATLAAAGLGTPSEAATPAGAPGPRPAGAAEIDPLAFVPRLPAALRPTAEQQAQVRTLTEAFIAATRADRQALDAVFRDLRTARLAGAGQAELQAILERVPAIQARLQIAEATFRAGVLAVLTPEQRSWIDQQRQAERARWQACQANPLTDAQREQLGAVTRAFETTTRADREALAAVLREADAARRAGRPAAEVRAILDQATPIRQRLDAAQAQLRTDLRAVLTPVQLASGCWVR